MTAVVLWEGDIGRDHYRVVRRGAKLCVLEIRATDSMGEPSWRVVEGRFAEDKLFAIIDDLYVTVDPTRTP